jgi:N-acetylmuramoyl-L-alanine amidase
LTLVLAGVALWWWQSAGHAKAHSAQPASARRNASPALNAPSDPVPAQSGVETAAEAPKESVGREITGIRHWSSADSSTVAIDLQEQVQYEAHRLSNPERIYFDLRDTSIAGGLPGNVEVDDTLLSRIRIAHPSADVTRVVLETKNNSNFSVKLETNPYRLLIEVRGAGAKPKPSAKVDLFAPLNATEKNQQMADSTPEQGNWLAPATTASNLQPPASGPGHGMRIVLDAGHGGWDMGTVGQKGLLEKDLVLDIVARLGKLVTNRLGAEVIYTRRDDTYIPLEKRTETANFAQADLFLSVHANYSDSPAARGVETYYTNTYSSARSHMPDTGAPEALNVEWLNVDIRGKVQQSRGFAATVQQSLYSALAVKSPELRNRGVKEASYVVLTGTTMPAILAEVSFVSSPEDEAKLESSAYRQEIAEGLYKGIAAYADTQRHVNVASALNRSGGQ